MPSLEGISNKYQFQISADLQSLIFLITKRITNFKSFIGNFKLEIIRNKDIKSRNLKFKQGFSLIEILLSLIFIGAIVTILLTTSGSLFTRRQSNLQSIAAKIATKEIEYLRGLRFLTELKPRLVITTCGKNISTPPDCTDEGLDAEEFKYLPDGYMKRTISDYAPSTPDEIYEVNIIINWLNDNDAARDLKMDTLIYKSGL